MPWEPKAGVAPAFSLGQAFAALVTGDTSLAWLAGYIPLVQDIQINTDALCAAGPPPDPDLSTSIFQWDHSPTSPGSFVQQQTAIAGADLVLKIQQVALARVFGAYCSFFDPAATCQTLYQVSTWNWATPTALNVAGISTTDITYDVSDAHGAATTVDAQCYVVSDAAGSNPVKFDEVLGMAPGSVTHTGVSVPAGAQYVKIGGSANVSGPGNNITCQVCLGAGSGAPYTPTPQPPPPNFVPREVRSYPDLAAVGKELDAQELKLDTILSFLMASNLIVPRQGPITSGADTAAIGSLEVPIQGYRGIVCTATHVADSVSERFGPPATFHGLGQLVFHAFGGNGPVVEIDCDPFVFSDFPADAVSVSVQYFPPSTGTYRLIPKV